MAMSNSGQKFIARNRAPRVQIEYDVEIYGAERKIQLPFVMGVMADLVGKPVENLPAVDERKFLGNRHRQLRRTHEGAEAARGVPVDNTLTGEGKLNVDLTFDSMDDFLPDAVARKVEPLNKLLEARTQLSNLLTYMDGKNGAEELIAKILQDPTLLKSLSQMPKK
ncbi:type VI secretion system contractile sheath small subunit [Enterobacter hormaechei]|uniref:Type VI secretion system contractile sheath small subunit n=1 Tax=Enterobacter hormaechei TaxID=158836 RepID=A0A927HNG5_9ENTR|nr:type VI secretion system contractile sheath small subunit [Enterobacter hormaechei]MBD3706605.1 type VI secretion system contractile sheath small subunit [Enterobacter hormaechei]MBD3717355.1 type VI secretion system contractile sheath small subunit [Enterobacter hormaechei]